ncbi:uncharacterized protein LOC126748138 [Anthonomus grandis grandis]|uniref:uncharacterized protein LOC126748138 n=1 Tax=Anthonomus grandis grandis TaxID=2921223 RepID=UPI0021660594|nr:uncharacterized protein LOC126748138 [Anthonomus grandis grandis]
MSTRELVMAAQLLMEEEADDDILVLSLLHKRRRKVHNMFVQRRKEGCFSRLIMRHLIDDETKFTEYFRLTRYQFNELFNLVSADIKKSPTKFVRRPITAKEKLALVLRFLATGESYRSMAFNYRISHNYISVLVRDVLKVLYNKLVPLFLKQPSKEDYLRIAGQFDEKWNFPNCCGAIDGKHVRIICPQNSGSLFFNYKSFFCIVLLAIVDAEYKFVCIDVGSYGKEGDSNIFNKLSMFHLVNNDKYMPEDKPLPNSDIRLPYVILGDEAFKLSKHLLRPYPRDQANINIQKRVFNYRLCRARRTSENAFGLLCQTFRIFYTPIAVQSSTVDLIITIACCLHNMIRTSSQSSIEDIDYDMPKDNMIRLNPSGGNSTVEAFQIRNRFTEFFNSQEGSVTWQLKHVTATDN